MYSGEILNAFSAITAEEGAIRMKKLSARARRKMQKLEKRGFVAVALKNKNNCLVCTGCNSCTDGGGGGEGNGDG